MRDDDACAGLRSTVRQGERGRRDRNAFNPTHIVLGDIIAQAGQPLLDEVTQVVRERTIPEIGRNTRITLSALPTDATVTGAAAVAITNFLEHPSMFFDVA